MKKFSYILSLFLFWIVMDKLIIGDHKYTYTLQSEDGTQRRIFRTYRNPFLVVGDKVEIIKMKKIFGEDYIEDVIRVK